MYKEGADFKAKDSSGRTTLHFACCSWSSETISLILNTVPELIDLGDNLGRTPLHYSIWNACEEQIDIIRTLLERGADINQVDDYGMSALHHAAKGGRARAIPILVQRGSNMSLRELKNHKTASELAKTDRIRELMTVYSSEPYYLNSKNKAFLDSAVQGRKAEIHKTTLFSNEKVIVSKKVNRRRKGDPGTDPTPYTQNMVPGFLQDTLVKILRELQEIGVKGKQHHKRPYLFTGSWMEGVTSIEQLFERIKDITPNEAMLRVFNVVKPYEGVLPGSDGQEMAVSQFYGEYYNFEIDRRSSSTDNLASSRIMGFSATDGVSIAKLHAQLQASQSQVEVLKRQNKTLMIEQKELTAKLVSLEYDKSEGDKKSKKLMQLESKYVSGED